MSKLLRSMILMVSLVAPQMASAAFITSNDGYGGWSEMSLFEAFLISETGQGGFDGIEVGGVTGTVVNSQHVFVSGVIPGDGDINFSLDGIASGIMIIDVLTYGANTLLSTSDQADPNFGFSGRFTYIDGNLFTVDFFPADYVAVPEPSSLAMLGLVLVVLGLRRRQKVA